MKKIDFMTQHKQGVTSHGVEPFHNTGNTSNTRNTMGLKAISAGVLLCIAHTAAQAQAQAPSPAAAADDSGTTQVQDTVVIKGKALKAADRAQLKLDDVPGGTSLVKSSDVEKGRAFTNQDVLAYQPGVYAQSAGGADGIKISIRGSSINRGTNFFRSGALFMFDGLPVTGPGGTPYELFEPLGLSYTEILRGPNAFDYGSAFLGGAINYVTKTGKEADPFEVRLEAGSFGYRKEEVSAGGVVGAFDYYVSLADSHRNGFQAESRGYARGAIGNFGYRINPDLETRLIVRYRQTDNYQPGSLTRAQIAANPTQATPLAIAQDAHRKQPGSTWIGSTTTYTIDDTSKVDVGFVYHDYPIEQYLGVNYVHWNMTDFTASANYSRQDTWWGKQSNSKIGILSTRHLNSDQDHYVRIPAGATAGLPIGTNIRHADYGGADNVIHASNDLELAPKLWLTTGLAAINTQRSAEVTFPVTNSNYQRDTWNLAPRLGLRFNLDEKTQVYGNVSRSVEPPNSWAFLTTPPSFTSGPATGLASNSLNLKNQTANTVELGVRGETGSTKWTAGVYHSEVRNELLSVEVIPATSTTASVTAESNGTPTVHQGIELGAESILWQAGSKDKVSLRQAYTLNDFRFKNDPTFGKNVLPGIPRHFYQGEIQYEHPSGFYAGVIMPTATRPRVMRCSAHRWASNIRRKAGRPMST
jgi:iron complex outermembrane receptor protein